MMRKPKLATVLVVDDQEAWRRFCWTALESEAELQIVGEASDGVEAVHQAEQLRPEVVLLDIGLPTLNGIEAASGIEKVSPSSKILFVSQHCFPEIARAALSNGARGYVVKADARKDLLPAIKAVLAGARFVSASLLLLPY